MAAGHNWDWENIMTLFKWRAAKGEMAGAMQGFDWGMWFAKFWEFAMLNFTLMALVITIVYLTLGQLLIFSGSKENPDLYKKRQFPQFWLILMPALFQLLILRGALWKHQYWESPLAPFIAIAAALAVMLIYDVIKKANPIAAKVVFVVLLTTIFVFCVKGSNYYYAIRWRAPQEHKMLEQLNKMIPPDKELLSFDDFIVNQNSAKGPHYRPEVAWYLDRKIVGAQKIEDIEKYAATGNFPYYLMPLSYYTNEGTAYLQNLSRQLQQKYKGSYLTYGQPAEQTKDGKFLRAGMSAYLLFDLTKPAAN